MSPDTILRAADPLAARRDAADLDPRGAMAARVRAGAMAPTAAPARPRGIARRRLVLVGALATALAIALAVALPGGRPTPPDARAALVSAAQRTAAFTSGHLVWHMTYDQPALDLTNDVRYDGADIEVAWTSRHTDSGKAYSGGSRVVGGRRYARDDDRPFVDRGPAEPNEGRGELAVRLQAADALADAARAASDVRAEPAGDDATRYTATIASGEVPDVFRGPTARTAPTVTIVAVASADGPLRSLALRAPGEAVDIAFDGLGQPQGIVAP